MGVDQWPHRNTTDERASLTPNAAAIAHEIQARVTPAEAERLAGGRAVDPTAQEAFLRGEVYLDRLQRGERGDRRRAAEAAAIANYQRAGALDPGWTLAHPYLDELQQDPQIQRMLSQVFPRPT